MGEAALSSGSPGHLARIYISVDACKGPRDRNQQFFNGLVDLVCHLVVRRIYSSVVMTGTHSTPTKTHRFRRAPGSKPSEHVSVPARRSDNADVPVLLDVQPAAFVKPPRMEGSRSFRVRRAPRNSQVAKFDSMHFYRLDRMSTLFCGVGCAAP
jgi:hypothetical protein